MKLRVVSFNIRCCDDPNGHSIAERAPRLDAVVSPLDADLIGLQESTPIWMEYIEKYFGDNRWEFPGGLVVRIPGYNCHSLGSISGQRTVILQAAQCGQKQNSKKPLKNHIWQKLNTD